MCKICASYRDLRVNMSTVATYYDAQIKIGQGHNHFNAAELKSIPDDATTLASDTRTGSTVHF